jgi:hypothetical protein
MNQNLRKLKSEMNKRDFINERDDDNQSNENSEEAKSSLINEK